MSSYNGLKTKNENKMCDLYRLKEKVILPYVINGETNFFDERLLWTDRPNGNPTITDNEGNKLLFPCTGDFSCLGFPEYLFEKIEDIPQGDVILDSLDGLAKDKVISITNYIDEYIRALDNIRKMLPIYKDDQNKPIVVHQAAKWYCVGRSLILKDEIISFGSSGYKEGIHYFVTDDKILILMESNNVIF